MRCFRVVGLRCAVFGLGFGDVGFRTYDVPIHSWTYINLGSQEGTRITRTGCPDMGTSTQLSLTPRNRPPVEGQGPESRACSGALREQHLLRSDSGLQKVWFWGL